MTASLLLVILLVVIGTSARITRLITDDKITAGLRDSVIHYLTFDSAQRQALDDHEHDVNTALANGTPPPFAPALPPAENPQRAERNAWLSWLITCRWCAGLWVSLLVALVARAALTLETPLWTPLAWSPLDILTVPAVALTTSYVVGWLAEREG